MPEHLTDKLLSWASILEDGTRAQAETTATMPFIYPHVALMPDAHLGKGATVGSVLPTHQAIIPAAVGVDIGCGMLAVRTQFTRGDLDPLALSDLHESIARRIPLSAGRYNGKLQETAAPRIAELTRLAGQAEFDPGKYAANWALQLGSLGSGNHFIEVTVDELDRVWLFLHSGSRGVGNKIAAHHIKVAQKRMKQWHITPPDPDLAYLPEGTDEFRSYIREMTWAQKFAWLNREEMMDRCVEALKRHLGQEVERLETIGCFAGETEVLTGDGLRPIRDLAGGRHELLTTGGKWVKAPVKSFGEQRLYEITLGRYSQTKVIRATAEHRWLLRPNVGSPRTEAITTGLRIGDRLDYAFPQRADLTADFFIQEEHRIRWASNRDAVERRGWTVREVRRTNVVEEVFCAVVDGTHAFTLADNILTGNCHHNYTTREKHFGREVWLSRKGAIDAHEGVRGLIPGSMGAASYVVTGKGNPVALHSSPHGAGRNLSRSAARKKFTRESLDAAMAGVAWGNSDAFLDEHPEAYKDIDTVMADAADLVTVDHTLRQIVNVKGD